MKSIYLSVLLCLYSLYSHSTSIIPPQHIGLLVQSSPAIVLAKIKEKKSISLNGKIHESFHFQIIDKLKTHPKLANEFVILNMSYSFQGGKFKASCDLDFDLQKEYLLFISPVGNYWLPVVLDYGIFEKHSLGKQDYLVPSESYLNLAQIGNPTIQQLPIYKKDILLNKIKQNVNSGNTIWNDVDAEPSLHLNCFYASARTAPSHCDFLTFQGDPFRWTGFPNQTLRVRYAASGDNSHPTAIQDTKNAIVETKIAYSGINILDAGTHNYNPSCIGGSALTDEYIDFINSTYGSYRNALIVYNDPCEELPDLMSCSGIVAISGIFAIATHTYDGIIWNTSSYGYLLMNDNVGPCVNSTMYKLIVEHEFSHTLGFDHITTGTANMNPYCCYTINSLDVQCVDYAYAPIILASEFIDFTAQSSADQTLLQWNINSTSDYKISIERKIAKNNFIELSSFEKSIDKRIYADQKLNEVCYYRLKLVDQNHTSYSKIISVEPSNTIHDTRIVDLTNNTFLIENISSPEIQNIRIFNLQGNSCTFDKPEQISNVSWIIKLNNLPNGIYIASLHNKDVSQKILISN